jgi:hypothetical protein
MMTARMPTPTVDVRPQITPSCGQLRVVPEAPARGPTGTRPRPEQKPRNSRVRIRRTESVDLRASALVSGTVLKCADSAFGSPNNEMTKSITAASSLDGICQALHEYACEQRPPFGMTVKSADQVEVPHRCTHPARRNGVPVGDGGSISHACSQGHGKVPSPNWLCPGGRWWV